MSLSIGLSMRLSSHGRSRSRVWIVSWHGFMFSSGIESIVEFGDGVLISVGILGGWECVAVRDGHDGGLGEEIGC